MIKSRTAAFSLALVFLAVCFIREGAAQAPPTGITVDECVVYSVQDPTKRVDCSAGARELCNGKPMCELPIGLAISGGRDIDPRGGSKVKVRLSCGARKIVEGPHDQDEHAAMILVCPQ